MTIAEMHYDFKRKLNKVDSLKNKNLLIPEIDRVLNESYELFVKLIAFPRNYSFRGFEVNQRTIDDLRTLIENPVPITVVGNVAALPAAYWHYVRGYALCSKTGCTTDQDIRVTIRKHGDIYEDNSFEKSDFAWRQLNAVFVGNEIRFDADFTVETLNLTYLKRPEYIHYADGFTGNTYTLPSTTVLVGTQDCELPDHTHNEIVDLAVLLASGELGSPNLQVNQNKLSLNSLI